MYSCAAFTKWAKIISLLNETWQSKDAAKRNSITCQIIRYNMQVEHDRKSAKACSHHKGEHGVVTLHTWKLRESTAKPIACMPLSTYCKTKSQNRNPSQWHAALRPWLQSYIGRHIVGMPSTPQLRTHCHRFVGNGKQETFAWFVYFTSWTWIATHRSANSWESQAMQLCVYEVWMDVTWQVPVIAPARGEQSARAARPCVINHIRIKFSIMCELKASNAQTVHAAWADLLMSCGFPAS